MPSFVTVDNDPIAVGTTARLQGTFVEEDGVTPFVPTSCTLTLTDRTTGAVINSREDVDVVGDISIAGELSFELSHLDNVITDETRTREQHSIVLEWEWSDPARRGSHRIDFWVESL